MALAAAVAARAQRWVVARTKVTHSLERCFSARLRARFEPIPSDSDLPAGKAPFAPEREAAPRFRARPVQDAARDLSRRPR